MSGASHGNDSPAHRHVLSNHKSHQQAPACDCAQSSAAFDATKHHEFLANEHGSGCLSSDTVCGHGSIASTEQCMCAPSAQHPALFLSPPRPRPRRMTQNTRPCPPTAAHVHRREWTRRASSTLVMPSKAAARTTRSASVAAIDRPETEGVATDVGEGWTDMLPLGRTDGRGRTDEDGRT